MLTIRSAVLKAGQVNVESYDLISPRPDFTPSLNVLRRGAYMSQKPFLILKLELSLSRSIMLHPFSPNHSPPKNPPARSPL